MLVEQLKIRRPRKMDQEWPNKELEIQQKRANLAKYCPEEPKIGPKNCWKLL